MAGLPVPPGWQWSGERVEICVKCGRPDYRSKMHVTYEGNLECDLHSERTAGYLDALNQEAAQAEAEDVSYEGPWQQTPHSIPSSR